MNDSGAEKFLLWCLEKKLKLVSAAGQKSALNFLEKLKAKNEQLTFFNYYYYYLIVIQNY